MLMTRFTFTKLACIVLMCWYVILIVCQMTCEQLMSCTQNQWIACKYDACKCPVKIELYRMIEHCTFLHLENWLVAITALPTFVCTYYYCSNSIVHSNNMQKLIHLPKEVFKIAIVKCTYIPCTCIV